MNRRSASQKSFFMLLDEEEDWWAEPSFDLVDEPGKAIWVSDSSYPFNVLEELGAPPACQIEEYRRNLSRLLERGIMVGLYNIYALRYIRHKSPYAIAQELGSTENHIERQLAKIRHILKKNRLYLLSSPEETEELPPLPDPDYPEPDDIERLELSIRAYNCLRRAGVRTLDDLCRLGQEGLKGIRNLGQKSQQEIIQKVEETFHIQL